MTSHLNCRLSKPGERMNRSLESQAQKLYATWFLFQSIFIYVYVPITFLQKTSTGKCLTSDFYHWHFLQKTFTSKCLVSFFISFLFFPRQNLQSRKFCQVNQPNQLLYLTMEPLLSSVRWKTHRKGRYLKKTTSSSVIWSRLALMCVCCVSCFER